MTIVFLATTYFTITIQLIHYANNVKTIPTGMIPAKTAFLVTLPVRRAVDLLQIIVLLVIYQWPTLILMSAFHVQ